MRPRTTSTLLLSLSGLLALAACTSEATPEPSPSEAVAAAAASTSGAPVAPACAAGSGPAADLPDWPLAAGDEPEFLPVVMSSLVTYGHNRFLYNVLDESYRQMAAPDLLSRVDFYALERDPDTPFARAGATYLSSGLGRGLYRTEVDLDCVGE